MRAEEASRAPFRVDRGTSGYPAKLERVRRPPASLWCVGRLPSAARPAVAIVGSRAASAAGREAAGALARALATSVEVISGGALGVDAAAHEGALACGGATFAVLGSGPDVVYPDRHAALFTRITGAGGLVSEHAPGTPPRSKHFPTRNRIIVGLCDAVVVVEAQPRSGALITARLARQAGVTLLARPGSAGTEALLRDGAAGLCQSPSDVEEALAGRLRRREALTVPDRLAPLVRALGEGPADAATLGRRLGLPLGQILSELGEAELEGFIARRPGNMFEVRLGQ
jgi:DNA processing protein